MAVACEWKYAALEPEEGASDATNARRFLSVARLLQLVSQWDEATWVRTPRVAAPRDASPRRAA